MRVFFRHVVIIAMITFLLGCSSSFGYQVPNYEKIADKLTEKTARKMQEQKHLYLVGTGGGMMDDIQAMHMSFHLYQEVDLKTARELLVYVVNEYLAKINNNKEIRPYLHDYPFTPKNVEIRIWIYQPDGTSPALDKIYYISALEGILTYYLDLPETFSRKAICKETYEEALQTISSK